MTEKEMLELVEHGHGHPAWSSFVIEMKDRHYGWDPLNQAWAFYRHGWDTQLARLTLSEEEREALRWVLKFVHGALPSERIDPASIIGEQRRTMKTALAVINRLIISGGTGES